MRPLLVGELNPYGADPAMALYPLPLGASGDRLREILGLSFSTYLRSFDRVNLCTWKWRKIEAVVMAGRLLERPRPFFVLLGRKVADAFLRPGHELLTVVNQRYGDRMVRLVLLPHPSGRCRIWNDPGAVETARRLVREAW